jgi:hypothetical protein
MSYGTGFIVNGAGWIATALHVVADHDTLTPFGPINIFIQGRGQPIKAERLSPLNDETKARDIAILKIDAGQLAYINLGDETQIQNGSPIAILGFPFSAFGGDLAATPQFCLSGTVAAQRFIPLTRPNSMGVYFQGVRLIYFQGVSIKGISGAPIISLASGKVIGIVSTKLTGIGPALEDVRKNTSAGGDVEFIGTNGNSFGVAGTITKIINVLDDQLANGLGSGTGADDVAILLTDIKGQYERQHPKK